ncbi:MAG TPA: signal peptidase I [Solirubrobacteraceae bacterium]|nr:signal peptidase I [Solirubrobacteraceae bacterium]
MRRPTRLRSGLFTAAFVGLAIVAWLYLAPTQIGGTTRYVVTSGISMEPSFHTGDLALVRPADQYRVGQVVAYHSTLLHVTVLHRIVAHRGGRYFFKGDNNNFIDPTHPTRNELIGALWVRVPHGGRVLAWLHSPLTAAVLTGFAALLVLSAFGERRRRRNRRKRASESGRQGAIRMNNQSHGAGRLINVRALLIASVVAMGAFLSLGVIAFTNPLHRSVAVNTNYTQQVTFGYHASAPAGPVYPGGVVRTGQPIFLQLVHNALVRVDYHLNTSAPASLSGTQKVTLQLTGPTGWTRDFQLAGPTHFTGTGASSVVTLDLKQLQSVLARVQKLTGISADSGYTIAVVPKVHVTGTVAGQPVNTTYAPRLSFQLQATQLQPGAGSFTPSQKGSVAGVATTTNTLGIAGHSLSVQTIRWAALGGFLLALAVALGTLVFRRSQPFEEAARIQEQYGHLMVPIINAEDLGWPPIDVPNIKALARLADSGERLILHHRGAGVDTYLVNDEGTVYRYQAKPIKVVWQEWAKAPVETPETAEEPAEAAAA